jgi:hypothetical protein
LGPAFGSLFDFGSERPSGLPPRAYVHGGENIFDDRNNFDRSDFEKRYERRYGTGQGSGDPVDEGIPLREQHHQSGIWGPSRNGNHAEGQREELEQTFKRMEEMQRDMLRTMLGGFFRGFRNQADERRRTSDWRGSRRGDTEGEEV